MPKRLGEAKTRCNRGGRGPLVFLYPWPCCAVAARTPPPPPLGHRMARHPEMLLRGHGSTSEADLGTVQSYNARYTRQPLRYVRQAPTLGRLQVFPGSKYYKDVRSAHADLLCDLDAPLPSTLKA